MRPEGRFYRYLLDTERGVFVGEAAYHFDETRGYALADVIVQASERGRGFGGEGLALLCEAARLHGLDALYDELAPDNAAAALFRAQGFAEVGRGEQGVLFRKALSGTLNRVLVLGCPGSGKSVFARALRDLSGLPLHHLDMLYHRPDRTTAPPEDFDAALRGILSQPQWLLDGNYQRTLPLRFAHCDTAFVFDLPVGECLEGVRARVGLPREDMPWTEEALDPEFAQYVLDFPRTQRPQLEALVERYRKSRRVVVFSRRAEAEQYLLGLRRTEQQDA